MTDDCLIHCVRVPKSGSKSLGLMLADAFAGRRVFYLPDTLRPETSLSGWQRLRLWRSQRQNLMQKLGVLSLDAAFAKIEAEGRPGDLIAGGHSDQGFVRSRLSKPVRFITLLRDPVERAVSDYHYARAGYLKKKPWQRFDAHLLAGVAGTRDFSGFLDFQLEHETVFANPAAAFLGWRGGPLDGFLAGNLWDWATLATAEKLAARIAERLDRPAVFGRHNQSEAAGRAQVAATDRTRIERLCARDYDLYERCALDNL